MCCIIRRPQISERVRLVLHSVDFAESKTKENSGFLSSSRTYVSYKVFINNGLTYFSNGTMYPPLVSSLTVYGTGRSVSGIYRFGPKVGSTTEVLEKELVTG